MPVRLRSTLQRSLSRPLGKPVFYCPSCATWRRSLSTRIASTDKSKSTPAHSNTRVFESVASHTARSYSSASTSAIRARGDVPARFKELHHALSGIQNAAIEQVNVSRLQLALRGLESETPVIRVAVLGLDTTESARRLVRLLLADPLGDREEWEEVLEDYRSDSTEGLLIRYGEVSEFVSNDLLPTITVRSPILKNANLEILVSSLGSSTDSTGATFSADTFLVPTVTIPTSHTGQHNFVRYPVHRSIVCGSGVDGLLAFSTLLARSDLKNEIDSVRGAIELSVSDKRSSDRLSFVDVERASTALDKIRQSVQNATEYERGWSGSGVQPLIDWFASMAYTDSQEGLNPALVPLIESLLDSADEGIAARNSHALQAQEAGLVPALVRSKLDEGVATWAERAHSELRSALEEGFASPRWRGLAWWKLFWRVDDVSMITSEILEKRFLQRAERETIWSSGQYQQAGLLEEPSGSAESTSDSKKQPTPPPWPTQIPDTRTKLLRTTIPSLQALAQSLVLFSVSTTTLTSALSALTYFSVPSASVYESGTLVAVGLIYSLRRQQKRWDAARGFWEEEVLDEGRNALRETEELMRKIVREGGKIAEDLTDYQSQEAVDRARKALARVMA